MTKRTASNASFELDSLIIVFTAEDASPVRYALGVAGRPDTGLISVQLPPFALPALRNWKATIYTIDEEQIPVYSRDTVHIDSTSFAVRPADTALVTKVVSPAFSILRARFVSSLADSIPNNVLWIRLSVDGVVRDSQAVGGSLANLNWLQALSGSAVVTVGDSGKILRSVNNGASWSLQTLAGYPDMAAGFFPNDATGFAVSRAGMLYKSDDSGKTWTSRNPFADSVGALFMTGTDAGFAAGRAGGIYKFIGEGWTKHATISNTSHRVNGIHFPSAAVGYAVGENETILKTTNGTTDGYNVLWSAVAGGWFPQNSETTSDIRGVHFITKDIGWAVGAGGYARVTYDGGATWESRNRNFNINSITFWGASRGWMAGDGGEIRQYVSEWNWKDNVVSGTSQNLYEIRAVGNDTVFVVGANGTLRRTVNGSAESHLVQWSGMNLPSSTASAWSSRNSNTGSTFNALHFGTSSFGLAVGASRVVSRTTDGGETWTAQTVGNSNGTWNAVFALNANVAYVAGSGGNNNGPNANLRRTTDGGASWTVVPSGISSEIRDVTAASSTVGWIVGASNVIRSTNNLNAGTPTWTDRNVGTGHYNAIDITSGNVWVVGENAQVRRAWGTADNAAFSAMNNSNLGSTNLRDVQFLASNQAVGWVVGDDGFIAKTTSGTWSVDWVVQGTPVTEDLVDVMFLNADVGYVTGANGTVLKTVNGGAVWTVLGTGSSASLNGVYAQNENTVIAAGGAGTVLKTTIGGQQPSVAANLRSLSAVNSSLVFVAGDSGTIGKTTNGGATWTKLSSGTSAHLYGIHFANANVGWAVGTGGAIVKTTNGGTSWTAQTSNTTQNLRSVRAVSPDTAYAVGPSGLMLKTVNGGATWYTQETPAGTPQLNRVHFLNGAVGYAVGANGTILKAVNQGDNWTGGGIKRSLKGVYFVSTTTGWIVGADGIILKTTDGGTTWIEQRREAGQTLYGVYFRSATLGWVTGENGLILKTTNGGSTWTEQTSNTSITLRWAHFRDNNTGFVIGGTQSMLATSNGGSTWNSNLVGGTGAKTFDQTLVWKYLRPGQAHDIRLQAIDRESPLRGYQSTVSMTVGAGIDSTLVSPMTRCGYGSPTPACAP